LAVLAFAFVHTAASKDDKPEFQIEVGKLADAAGLS